MAQRILDRVKTFDDFVEDSRKLVGLPVISSSPHVATLLHDNYDCTMAQVWRQKATLRNIKQSCFSIGDDNPLYTDPKYGRYTRWGSLIAHPTFVAHLRYNMWHGALGYATYAVTSLVAGFNWEWYDVMRLGDEFKSTYYAKDVVEKKGRTGRLCFQHSHSGFWNQYKELIATGSAVNCIIGKEDQIESIKKKEGVRTDLVYDRGVYQYSDDEITKIVDGIEGEKRRGADPLYWEDVNVGDKFTPVVKGPLTRCDLMGFDAAADNLAVPSFELAFRRFRTSGGGYKNTLTRWPYDSGGSGHYDWDTCRSRGLPAPFDVGCMRAVMTSHLLSNWMGDNGFIRRVSVQIRKPNFYGDTTFYNAEVVKTYKDTVGDEEYGAVDISIVGTNQLGEVSTPGKATIYLPSPGRPVKIPIPHEDNYNDYETFVKDCTTLERRRQTVPTWPITP